MNTLLSLSQVDIAYDTHAGRQDIVRGFSMDILRGQIACLLGSSGCGKSTLLRAIAGFEPVRAGAISIDGQLVSSPSVHVLPERRRVGMMFQDYALFPHLNVADNVGFGLRRMARKERVRRVVEMLELVGLKESRDVFPHELSGGQQQRVALARSLAPAPDLLLLDEPFANLDVDMRERLAFELRDLLCATGLTVLLVTHNQAEAFAIADRIGVMASGELLQWDTPVNLLEQPRDGFVAHFIRQEALIAQRHAALAR